jgi:hypothetical protein
LIGQNMITSPVRERLQRQFGNAGFGFVSFNTSAVVAGNGAQYHYTLSVPVDWSVGVSSATPGPDTSAVVSATAGSTITLVAKDVTQLRLMFQRQAGAGTSSSEVEMIARAAAQAAIDACDEVQRLAARQTEMEQEIARLNSALRGLADIIDSGRKAA